MPGTGVPLYELIEQYQLNFYTDNTYSTSGLTLTSNVETLTLTTAQQTSAFGGLLTSGNCFWDVRQLGRLEYGYPARGIL